MKVTVLYVGSSLPAPLRHAEREISRDYRIDLCLGVYNFGGPFTEDQWAAIAIDLSEADVVFVIHVMDGENASRLLPLLDRRLKTTVVINCMPELMRRTRLGKLNLARLPAFSRKSEDRDDATRKTRGMLRSVASWVARQTRDGKSNSRTRTDYLKWAERLPGLLRLVPGAGPLRDAKNYLLVVSYFLQPTPSNIKSMILLALKEYGDDERLREAEIAPPEAVAAVAIYHPDAPALFESVAEYSDWYARHLAQSKKQSGQSESPALEPSATVGLLLLRPQIVSNSRKHYDALIRAIESEGLSVVPAISTLMDNREACDRFFISTPDPGAQSDAGRVRTARVSQIVSLTGFSFVGGPAMNDSEAAAGYLTDLRIPYRSLVSLDTQTIESWRESSTGLNPVQTGMQVAIPEIDGATEPFVFGGIPALGVEPAALADRCAHIARRLKRWHRLQTANRNELKIALVLYCFPPNKGNIGTGADLDVFASLGDILPQLKRDGYRVEVPRNVDALRERLLGTDTDRSGAMANIAYRMKVEEYRALCPFAAEIEREWGAPPGAINSDGDALLIQGLSLGNVFIAIQPTFGFEDDPMRLLMAKGVTPHHGFAAFYAYLEKVFAADAVVHVGTHGALEFMPGKQVGLSAECWPDRLIDEMPNIYIYSVNNPSEGTIAKRRSYAELISYLTPPIENAGLYKGLAALKDLVESYRMATTIEERERIYPAIEEARIGLNLDVL